ncbi:uncharacterized protein RAG0_16205 [Rhynchosporium agropyri]|uniref:Uncharacterized protein n=1 Tax=Rhynchosporium agropyri TaxID=914238 RepID=A0A1E1LPG6_9HELO|nr:uncharacterized protein RAG0_16205 [Rhynchosporium agropyri]
MQLSQLAIILATLALATQILASPIPYITKVDTACGQTKYVCVDSDLSCLTKRILEAVASKAAGVEEYNGHAITSITHEHDQVVNE